MPEARSSLITLRPHNPLPFACGAKRVVNYNIRYAARCYFSDGCCLYACVS